MEQTVLRKVPKDKILNFMEYFFKISYLFLAIATFNSFIFGKPIMSFLVMVTFVVGSLLMIERLIHWKEYIGMPYLFLLILFCVSFFISMILNREFGIVENAKWLVWTGFQMFLLYVKKRNEEIEKYYREFEVISKIITWYSFGAAIISIVLMLTRYSNISVLESNGQRIIQGFIWGRLWGVYTDPNYGAVIGVVSIILSLHFLQKTNKILFSMYIMNMVVQFLYIVFSDSRTGKVTLIICIGFYVYTLLLKKNSIVIKIKKKILDLMIAFLVCILIVLGMNVVRITYNNVVSPIISKTFFTEEEVNEEEENKENKIGREEDIKADPSNRRFSIWASGFEILKTSPIFGTGYVTFVPYAEENVPNTYVLKNDHGTFASMHNGFLNVLVYQGILGFIIYILFAICTAVKILKSIWKLEGEQYRFGIAMLSCVAAIVCSMMFLLEGTYTNSIGSIVLWCNLGWLVCLVDKKNKTTYSS